MLSMDQQPEPWTTTQSHEPIPMKQRNTKRGNTAPDNPTTDSPATSSSSLQSSLQSSHYQWCNICGHEFDDLDNPLAQEKMWIVHYTGEHLLDEMNDGKINADDLLALDNYFEVDQDQFVGQLVDDRVLGVEGAVGRKGEEETSILQQYPVLAQSVARHNTVRRRKFWFALCFTTIVFYIVWTIALDSTSTGHQGFKLMREYLKKEL